MPDQTRIAQLRAALSSRILVLDGAMGTAIQDLNLTAKDFGGAAYEGCNENLVLTAPEVVRKIHQTYLEAGADIVETDTFGGTPVVLAEFELADKTYAINFEAARLAREAADKFTDKTRFVAGSIGPTTKAISVTGGITFNELVENFYAQAKGLVAGGSDYLLIETSQDTRNIKAALIGIGNLFKEIGDSVPVAISGTIEPMGTMLGGQTVEALWASVAHANLLYIGLNCATGPEFMTDHIRSLAELANCPIACVPNAGLPDEEGRYLETPQMMSQVVGRFMNEGWINLIGGCCGTRPDHIAAFAKLVKNIKPRVIPTVRRSFLSGLEYLEITDDLRPLIVGERTNVIGSKKFKELIVAGKYEEASEVGRAQVKNGAHILDACLANPDREEKTDMSLFLDQVIRKVKVPLMIDSTDEAVIEEALTYCQGKAIINSVNLEDGEERFEKVVPLARKFGAALVVGTIDDDPDQGMGVTRKRKLEIAERSYALLTGKYGVPPEDIYWDPLVFPCATGDQNYVGSAPETIEGIRLIKERFPATKTVLGISNVSFGLPPLGREVLNSVFLYHCVSAGLDLAIVNSEKLERYASIGDTEKQLAEDLLFNRGKDPIAAFAAHFRGKKASSRKEGVVLPLDERLGQYIIEGSKEGLIQDLELKLKESRPLEIINGPLMKGMDEVGRLFNANKLIVAEVLQSAEAMKAAVAYLEAFMEKKETSTRGKIVLATVKGDVHDIGKNLVEIILSNNGFEVVNLGIKVPPQTLIEAVRKHNPDIVGLSGLLVKSAQQMVSTAADFAEAGVSTPILVGGAALSERFVDTKISKAYGNGTVAYAPDAMKGLELAKTIVDKESFEKFREELATRRKSVGLVTQEPELVQRPVSTTRSIKIDRLTTFPQPPDFRRHVLAQNTSIDQVWNYINPMMLYGRHLGVRGQIVRLLTEMGHDRKVADQVRAQDEKAFSIWEAVEEVKQEYRGTPFMAPSATYQFFSAYSEGNTLVLLDQGNEKGRFEFPRQSKAPGLCLADLADPDVNSGDNIALFAVTVGRGLREEAERLKNSGAYLKSHIVQALALESAEAFAEFLHAQIRRMWGVADSPQMTMLERFQGKYHGKRYSFGYPACPNLADQEILFRLLEPASIGIALTEGHMMDPEASVSALVFHHPQASYFSVGAQTAGEI